LPWALRYGADVVLTVYERQAAEVRHEVPSSIPVVAVANGIHVDHYTQPDPDPEGTTSLREGASHVAVLVGHVSQVKGYPTYLRAAAEVLRKYPRALFLCAGGETIGVGYTDAMRALAANLGISDRVRFLGVVTDVRRVLRAADVFVLPSEQEGLPLAALEAMSCGLPVIATPVNGVPEAVSDGETGVLVPVGDHVTLAAALGDLFGDSEKRERLGNAGEKRVRARFSVDRVQQRLLTLYADVLGRRVEAGHYSC